MTLVSLEETKSNTYYILHKTIAKKQYGGVTGINIPNAYVETIEKFNAMVVKQYNIEDDPEGGTAQNRKLSRALVMEEENFSIF